MFVYLGAIIPWHHFSPRDITPHLGIWQLFLFLGLVLLFRRIPILLAVQRFVPNNKTYREALFCGHFWPMGLEALFLAMEARAQLETGTSRLLLEPIHKKPYDDKARVVELVWPVVCFIVLGSTMVHGLSVAVFSIGEYYSRKSGERAPLIGYETKGLYGIDHETGNEDTERSVSGDEPSPPVR
jgi:NhaP-type Na+/H+ or K+/H+ antiporter